jgi:hypothetical protein
MSLIISFIVILFGALCCLPACSGLERREVRYATYSYGFHVVSAFVMWWLTEVYYGVADAHGYIDDGVQVARALSDDFFNFAPEVLKYAFHLEFHLPFDPYWGGTSGTMSAVTGLIVLVVGPSLLACNLVSGLLSWLGTVCLYRVVREEVGPDGIRPALLGIFFVPSVVFWCGALTKESIVMGALGVLSLSTYRVFKSFRLEYVPALIASGLLVALIKPYVLFPYLLSTAAWIYAARAWAAWGRFRVRPVYLVLAAGLAVGGIALMGEIYPEFAVGNLSANFAGKQDLWQQVEGGSNTDLGSGEARTFGQQLPFVPLATINALFRPVIFEAKNGPQFVAAIETLLFALGVLGLFGKHSRSVVGEAISRSPLLVFCISFVASFAVAVGLATSNLGSLSRYRVPMMPFYATALLLLREKARAHASLATSSVATKAQRFAARGLQRSRHPAAPTPPR